jgi:hypothetical protein
LKAKDNGDGEDAAPPGGPDAPQALEKAGETEGGNGDAKNPEQEGGPDEQSLKPKKPRAGKHPNSIAHQFRPGESGNPDGRPPGIPNLNDQLITAIGRFKGGKTPSGKKGRKKFLQALLEKAMEDDPVLLGHILDKVFADATPKAGAQVNVNSQVTNEHALHQTILADPRVREAALDLEERIADSLTDAGGPGSRK